MSGARRGVAVLTGLALAAALCGCAAEIAPQREAAPEPTRAAVRASVEASGPIRLAVIGDSITSWAPPYAGERAQSWVFSATSNAVPLVGGWARPGATIADMRAALGPVDDVDVLVVMAGTNDVYQGSDPAQRLADLDAMVATVGARVVIVSSTAPYGYDVALGAAWNSTLAAHADARGWHYVDPWALVRDAGGSWLPGADYGDGIHPSPASAAIVGEALRGAILKLAR
jgi:lysophospholipase L1-like esterase